MKPDTRAAETVRVSIPASTAANIDHLKKAVGSVLDHLGCDNCCSGKNIFFELQRDVVFSKDLRAAEPFALRRDADTFTMPERTVDVKMNPELAGEIDNVFAAIDRIAELTGHAACATGCDMRFNLERILVIDAASKIQEKALAIG